MNEAEADRGSSGNRAPTGSEPVPKKGCGPWLLGCLAVPFVLLLILMLIMTVVSRVNNGHLVFAPEVDGREDWEAEGTSGEIVGGWHTGDAMVYGAEDGLVALEPESGDELWSLEPEPAVCGMSEEAPDGFGVVFLEGDVDAADVPGVEDERLESLNEEGSSLSCDVVMVVHTETGAELWRTDSLADESSENADLLFSLDAHAEPVGDQALVRIGGELVGLDRSSGSELWRRDSFAIGGVDCPATDVLARGVTEVVVAADCGIGGAGAVNLHVVDPATGEDVSAFEFPRAQSQPDEKSAGETHLVAADPIHVRVDLGHPHGVGEDFDPDGDGDRQNPTPTIAFDDDGNVLHQIDVHDLFGGTSSRERLFVVEGDRLYTTTSNSSCSNEVSAHDLGTGEVLWETRISDPGVNLVEVRGGRLLVMIDGNGSFGECSMFGPEWPWQLYTVDTATGEPEPLTPPLSNQRQPRATELWWDEDRVFHLEHPLGDRPGRVTAFG